MKIQPIIYSAQHVVLKRVHHCLLNATSHWVGTMEFNPFPSSKKPQFLPNYHKMATVVLSQGCLKLSKVVRLWKLSKVVEVQSCGCFFLPAYFEMSCTVWNCNFWQNYLNYKIQTVLNTHFTGIKHIIIVCNKSFSQFLISSDTRRIYND